MKALLHWLSLVLSAVEVQSAIETPANVVVEIPFTAVGKYADPFQEATVDVTFTDPSGKKARVPVFWAGKNSWKVRYASAATGTHSFRTECSNSADAGLHGITGTILVKPVVCARTASRRFHAPDARTSRWHSILLARRHVVDGPMSSAAFSG